MIAPDARALSIVVGPNLPLGFALHALARWFAIFDAASALSLIVAGGVTTVVELPPVVFSTTVVVLVIV